MEVTGWSSAQPLLPVNDVSAVGCDSMSDESSGKDGLAEFLAYAFLESIDLRDGVAAYRLHD